MIYLVCGTPRTGSSAFMQGAEAGGMNVVASPERDKFNTRKSDGHYLPNPKSLFEFNRTDILSTDWSLVNDGKALKWIAPFGCPDVFRFIDYLPVHEYRIVFLNRDSEEIRQSYEAMMGLDLKWLTLEYIEQVTITALTKLLNRRDCTVVEIEHRDLMSDPKEAFRQSGWPLDSHLAGSVIDKTLHRFRREQLVEGI